MKDRFGPAHSLPVYAAFFLSTSVRARWQLQQLFARFAARRCCLHPALLCITEPSPQEQRRPLLARHEGRVSTSTQPRRPV